MSEFEPLYLEDLALDGVDTSFPVLAAEKGVRMKLTKITKEQNKAQDGYNLVVIEETVHDNYSKKAKETGVADPDIKPGFKITSYFPLQPSKKSPDWNFKTNIAQLVDGYMGTNDKNRDPNPNFGALVNMETLATIKVEKDNQDESVFRNSIGRRVYPDA